MAESETTTLWLWVVDDGGRHWVVAESPDHALKILAQYYEMSVAEFCEDGSPSIEQADYTRPIKYDLGDCATYRKPGHDELPERCEIVKEHYARCMPVDIVKMGPCVFATTEY